MDGDVETTDVEIVATDPSGKADAIDGKHLRIRTSARIPWSSNADMAKWNIVDGLCERRAHFTFAECGIEPGGSAWSFEVFVLPLAATGRLEGTYEYRLGAEVH